MKNKIVPEMQFLKDKRDKHSKRISKISTKNL